MIKTIDMGLASWEVHPGDDPRFVSCAERLVAAAAMLAGQREIVVVRIDNWFGVRWLGFPMVRFRIRTDSQGAAEKKKREPVFRIPPFHPNRVLSERRYELSEGGLLRGPFQIPRPLHRQYPPHDEDTQRIFKKAREPGIYAWCSGNTDSNDRASLMVYNHTMDGTSAWYVEFRKANGWHLSRRTGIGDADWRRLLEVGGITELKQPSM